MTKSIIDIQTVSKVFGDAASGTVALQDVSLAISEGEFVSIIGPSGCGKSTLLRIIAGLIDVSKGQATVDGKTPEQARIDQDYGIVFQAPVLYEWRTVLRNVQLPLEIMSYTKADRENRARAMLDLVGLANFHAHFPWQLSGGMQQRVSIARALAFDPPLLLMDEPFGALDEFTREKMNLELLDIWQSTGKTLIFVTHSIAEAIFLSSRVVVMSPRPGRIADVIDIDLPYPRDFDTRESARFYELLTRVRETLRDEFMSAEG